MAKKLSKLAFLGVLAGAAAGSCYYYYQNKSRKKSESVSEDLDDFDDFDDDLEDEDFSSENQEGAAASKAHHIQIDFDLDEAREKIGGKVIETLDKTKETIDKVKEVIGERIVTTDAEPEYTEMDRSAASQTADEAPVAEEAAKADKAPVADDESKKSDGTVITEEILSKE